MSVTVWGDCGGPNAPAASYDRYGRLSARRLAATGWRDRPGFAAERG
jgi:hypothetical protein